MNKTEKLLRKLNPKQREAIDRALELLYQGQLSALDIKPLKGYKDTFRARVGLYRIIFFRQQNKIELIAIVKRDDQTYSDF